MTAPEIAEALGVKLNTVYGRLRQARREFDEGAARMRARDGWRLR
jgi:RNA polymerase sigma-70 factor (ECF subfamily)